MPKKTKAQGLSINAIILVVIALIVLVVIIAILTGRMGLFSKGLESAASCENTCRALGADNHNSLLEENCKDDDSYKRRIVPGTFSDITLPNNKCCCNYKK